jgi:hypothetical protein
MTEHRYHALAADLRTLGGPLRAGDGMDDGHAASVERAVTERLAATVATRVHALPAPSRPGPVARLRAGVRPWFAGRRRAATVIAAVLLLALLGSPPVRAAVAEWFGFGGVRVRVEPSLSPTMTPPVLPPPTVRAGLSLQQARQLVGFEPLLPSQLGPPQGIEVSADRRVLSISWTDPDAGPLRLDEFNGQLDPLFAKTAPGVEYTTVNDDFALWFDRPHQVVVLNPDGTSRTETARLAARTLIWQSGGITLRLEGDLTQQRAVEIAGSAVPLR